MDKKELDLLKAGENVPDSLLRALANVIENTKRAAYQEGILQFLTEDLRCFFLNPNNPKGEFIVKNFFLLTELCYNKFK